ncbi:MerR family transcriptional regulator [Lapidilactobacillus bayanensis]|uniref:hypothetical protein n=1 Tax=Lapidilactobacillus bayanensis TaxID=2485998 RepID=UPI000F79225A|nr:hypothetical protein [Lapidilactobacillus bayanensis]
METTYTPSQVAEKLHISVPTLRKYSLLIEEAASDSNYFPRNHQNVRSYTEKDLQDIQELVDYSKQNSLTLQKAAAKIFGNATPKTVSKTSVNRDAVDNDALTAQIQQLSAQLKQTAAEVAILTKRLDNIEATAPVAEVDHDQVEQEPQVLKTISLTPQTEPKSANANSKIVSDSGLNYTEPTVANEEVQPVVKDESSKKADAVVTGSEETAASTATEQTAVVKAEDEKATIENTDHQSDATKQSATTAAKEVVAEMVTKSEPAPDEKVEESAKQVAEDKSQAAHDVPTTTPNVADTKAAVTKAAASATTGVSASADVEDAQATSENDNKKKSWWQKMLKK